MSETSCCLFLTIIKRMLFEQMVSQIYPNALLLNKANSVDTEAPFLDLDLSITHGIVHLDLSITNGMVHLKLIISRMILV